MCGKVTDIETHNKFIFILTFKKKKHTHIILYQQIKTRKTNFCFCYFMPILYTVDMLIPHDVINNQVYRINKFWMRKTIPIQYTYYNVICTLYGNGKSNHSCPHNRCSLFPIALFLVVNIHIQYGKRKHAHYAMLMMTINNKIKISIFSMELSFSYQNMSSTQHVSITPTTMLILKFYLLYF